MTTTTQRRTARKSRLCDSCEATRILPGDTYLEHKLYPGNDIRDNNVPERCAECANCATRYGRGDLVRAAQTEKETGDE